MNNADWTASLRERIAWLHHIAEHASDEEVRKTLHEIAAEMEAEIAGVDRKYG